MLVVADWDTNCALDPEWERYAKVETDPKQTNTIWQDLFRLPRAAAQPTSGGIAPGTAPTNVLNGVFRFSGVYTRTYRAAATAASVAAIGLAPMGAWIAVTGSIAPAAVLLWLAVPALVIIIAWRRFGSRLPRPRQPPP